MGCMSLVTSGFLVSTTTNPRGTLMSGLKGEGREEQGEPWGHPDSVLGTLSACTMEMAAVS